MDTAGLAGVSSGSWVDWQIGSLARELWLYSRGSVVLSQASLNLLGREAEQEEEKGKQDRDRDRRTHRKLAWVKTGHIPTHSGSWSGRKPTKWSTRENSLCILPSAADFKIHQVT